MNEEATNHIESVAQRSFALLLHLVFAISLLLLFLFFLKKGLDSIPNNQIGVLSH